MSESETAPVRLPFKERFCQQHAVAPADFEKALLKRAARPLVWLVGIATGWHPFLFARDLGVATEAGVALSIDELENIVSAARDDDRREHRVLRRWLGFRISGRRLLAEFRRL